MFDTLVLTLPVVDALVASFASGVALPKEGEGILKDATDRRNKVLDQSHEG